MVLEARQFGIFWSSVPISATIFLVWPRTQLASLECRQKYGLRAPSAFLLLWYSLNWVCSHSSDWLHYILEPGRSLIEALHVEDKPGLNSIFQITPHTPGEGGTFTVKEKSHGSPSVCSTLSTWTPSRLNEFSSLKHTTEKEKGKKKADGIMYPKLGSPTLAVPHCFHL